MKKLIVMAACAALAGCDYSVPLVRAPGMDADAALVGLWERTNDSGQSESLLVLPLGKQEYLVSFPAGAKDGTFGRGCLTRCAGRTFVQIEWVGTARGARPDNDRVFQFAAYEKAGDRLTVRMLSSDVVNRDAKSPDELAAAVAKNKDAPDLFRADMVFTKAKD